ncbi:MAG: HU family DNA-binding protein [Nitrospirae bacterium]|nr:HU family DNA-binding protein [Nitrospirota bacterium]
MTKTEIASAIADDTKLSKNDVLKIIESFMSNVTKALTIEGKVTLVGFGSFTAKERKAREGRNPRTGDVITIPAARVPKFVPGANLREALIIKEKTPAINKPVAAMPKETNDNKSPKHSTSKEQPAKAGKKTKAKK